MSKSAKQKVVGPFLLIAGVVALGFGINERSIGQRLKSEGVTATGQIVEHRTARGRRGSQTYKLAVEFQPETGPSVGKEFSVSKDIFAAVGDGEPIRVRYLPSDPTKAEIPGAEVTGFAAMGIGAFLAIAGGLVSFFAYRTPASPPGSLAPAP